MTELSVYEDPSTYYRCTSITMWRLRPYMIDDVVAVAPTISGSAWLAAFVGSALLLAAALLPEALEPPAPDGVPRALPSAVAPDQIGVGRPD
jgi:hypothetical protein